MGRIYLTIVNVNNNNIYLFNKNCVDMMLAKLKFSFVVALLFLISIHSFFLPSSRSIISRQNVRMMADVEVVFPNNKKAKVAVGSALKDAAKKAGRILNV